MDATSWIMTGANGSILTDVGVVYVGTAIKLSDIERQAVEKIVSKYGLTVDDVITNYKARMVANVNYLYEKSLATEFKNKRSTNRRLF
jgi:hypothetical protein